MPQIALAGISIFIAVLIGFSISIVVSPDPTGIIPIAGTIILGAVLSPIWYRGFQRMTA
jgi:hypothetical protein